MVEAREKRPTSTTLYLAAAEEILKFGHVIPEDFLENYKKRDMNEVLRLLTKYGEIDCAVDVAIEILNRAMMSHKQLNNENISMMMDVPVILLEQVNSDFPVVQWVLQIRDSLFFEKIGQIREF